MRKQVLLQFPLAVTGICISCHLAVLIFYTARLLEELYLSEKRYADLLKMYLCERRDQSQYLADQLGVVLPSLLTLSGGGRSSSAKSFDGPGTKRLCRGSSGETLPAAGGAEGLDSPDGTTGSISSADTVTAEVRKTRQFQTKTLTSIKQYSKTFLDQSSCTYFFSQLFVVSSFAVQEPS